MSDSHLHLPLLDCPPSMSRPSKRRLNAPQFSFFTPAAQTFKPKPYTPNGTVVPNNSPPVTRNNSIASLAAPTPNMDPSPLEPGTLFIHPPFTIFPNSHIYCEGLTYAILAANPEWFLDAYDFISSKSTNPDAIPYPPQLEPPRGWCPAKKKDLKERGSDGWPEGEEPRLRCTFCRRTYAGVNAKSMWRRHVFEKHKIAMSNRRDGNERARGRGSNNRLQGKENGDIQHRAIPLTLTPQDQPEFTFIQSKPKYRSLLPADSACAKVALAARVGRSNQRDNVPFPSAPVIPQGEFAHNDEGDYPHSHLLSRSTLPLMSPPLTPRTPFPGDSDDEGNSDAGCRTASPTPPRPIIPPSPYNPARTPAFRHSPPRLPSDQPWRFSSPSHPLYSARDLNLSMVAIAGSSPLSMTPQTGPRVITNPSRHTPRKLFSKSVPIPVADSEGPSCHILESPLSRTGKVGKDSPAKFSDGWLSSGEMTLSSSPALIRSDSGLMDSPIPLELYDPFGCLYRPWTIASESGDEKSSPPASSPNIDSPVLRTSALPEARNTFHGSKPGLFGLGIGLMEPFGFLEEDKFNAELGMGYLPLGEGDDQAQVELTVREPLPSFIEDYVPGNDVQSPSRKRRRTISSA